jgi:opacity protein-like surface antigen
MRTKAIFVSAFLFSLLCPACIGQTDIAASLYGAFNESTKGNDVQQSPSNSAGVLLEVRHIRNPLIGYEATYSYNRANQAYSSPPVPGAACPTSGCGPNSAAISNNAHQVTGNWIVSLKVSNLRPFALAGGGILFNQPTGGTVAVTQCAGLPTPVTCQTTTTSATTSSSTKGVFDYGAGLDWTVLPHLGLRFQYRGNLYKAANLTNVFTSTNAFTQTAEPMVGAFLRF